MKEMNNPEAHLQRPNPETFSNTKKKMKIKIIKKLYVTPSWFRENVAFFVFHSFGKSLDKWRMSGKVETISVTNKHKIQN